MPREELPIEPVPGQEPIGAPVDMVEASPPATVQGYLIERPADEGRSFMHVEGQAISWTEDTVKAMRFTRVEDAKQAMALFNVLTVAHVAVMEFPV